MWRSSWVRSPERKTAASCRGCACASRIAIPADARPLANALFVEWKAVRSDVTKYGQVALDRLLACARRPGGRQSPPRRQRRSPDTGCTGGGHDRRQRPHPAGIMRRDRLTDHPAHRDAGQMRILVAEHVEQTDGVAGHVAEVVLPRMVAAAQNGERRRRRKGHMRGPADVAVVESDDAIAASCKRSGEVRWP